MNNNQHIYNFVKKYVLREEVSEKDIINYAKFFKRDLDNNVDDAITRKYYRIYPKQNESSDDWEDMYNEETKLNEELELKLYELQKKIEDLEKELDLVKSCTAWYSMEAMDSSDDELREYNNELAFAQMETNYENFHSEPPEFESSDIWCTKCDIVGPKGNEPNICISCSPIPLTEECKLPNCIYCGDGLELKDYHPKEDYQHCSTCLNGHSENRNSPEQLKRFEIIAKKMKKTTSENMKKLQSEMDPKTLNDF